MNGIQWKYNREFSHEYDKIQEAFYNIFRTFFDHDCSLPLLYPNYIAFRYDVPEGSNGVKCFQINKYNEYLFNAYPLMCCEEMTQETAKYLPRKCKTAIFEFDTFDLSRWILGSFLAFSVGIASIRTNGEWRNLNADQAAKLWDFVANISNQHILIMSKTIERVIVTKTSLAFGIMDFDLDYLVPYFQ